jgi:RHS repeat-associated protein
VVGGTVATTSTTYDWELDPQSVTTNVSTTASGTTTNYWHTTQNAYDLAGNLLASSIATTQQIGSGSVTSSSIDSAVPTTETFYDLLTGLPDQSAFVTGVTVNDDATSGSATVTSDTSSEYDELGRLASFTDATGATSTYLYDAAGNQVQETMPVGQVGSSGSSDDLSVCTYYPQETVPGTSSTVTDALGNPEYRNVPLVETVAMGSSCGTSGTGNFASFAAAYDGDGNQATTDYPNGIVATTTYDPADERLSLSYTYGSGTGVQSGYASQLMSYADSYDEFGDVSYATTPESTSVYAYDADGRLSGVGDDFEGTCQTRTYGFDADSNRTSYAAIPTSTSGGYCPTAATPNSSSTTASDNFDAPDTGNGVSSPSDSDRLVNSSWTTPLGTASGTYTYDAFGRVSSLPGDDTGQGGSSSSSAITLGYDALNRTVSMVQGSASESISYDPSGNVATTTWSGTSGLGLPSGTQIDHYDGSGSPAFIDNGNDTSTVYLDGLGAGNALNVTVPNASSSTSFPSSLASSSVSAQVNLQDLQGNVDGTAAITAGTSSCSGYNEQTEYGLPQPGTASNQFAVAPTYGWLGAYQKAEDNLSGLVLMGARTYDPVTGLFTESDPVLGGNVNAYTYPPDPENSNDLSGEKCGGWLGWACSAGDALGSAAHWVGHQFHNGFDHARHGIRVAFDWTRHAASSVGHAAKGFIPNGGIGDWASFFGGMIIMTGAGLMISAVTIAGLFFTPETLGASDGGAWFLDGVLASAEGFGIALVMKSLHHR